MTYRSLLSQAQAYEPFESLEDLLTNPQGFNLTSASNLQRAICRVVDQRPLGELWDDLAVRAAFHDAEPLPVWYPTIYILSGTRTGKSLWAAAAAVYASQVCDMSTIRTGEIPRVSVVSLSMDNARALFSHIVGSIQQSVILRDLLLEEPASESLLIRHPSGKPVEIRVVAGARSGGTLVSRWSAGVIFDEAPRMLGEEDGIVNLDEMLRSVKSRMRPRAPILCIGSPWAPRGPVWNAVNKFWGHPAATALVIRAPADVMNPVDWTPARVAALRAEDPDAARTDIDAEFADPETNLFTATSIDACMRAAPVMLPYESTLIYSAAMDPATRGNGWTLMIACIDPDGRYRVAYHREWRGSRFVPLSPKAVLEEMSVPLKQYGVYTVYTDQYMCDALRDLGLPLGIGLSPVAISDSNRNIFYENVRMRMDSALLELPPDPVVRNDLMNVKKRLTAGAFKIVLPVTGDGRHADYAAVLALLAGRYLTTGSPVVAKSNDDLDEVEREVQDEIDREVEEEKKEQYLDRFEEYFDSD